MFHNNQVALEYEFAQRKSEGTFGHWPSMKLQKSTILREMLTRRIHACVCNMYKIYLQVVYLRDMHRTQTKVINS